MHSSPDRRVSKLVIPIVIIVVLIVAGAYAFFALGGQKTTSSSAKSSPSNALSNVPLNGTVDQLVQDLDTRNVDGVVSFYSPTAVTVWSGQTGGLSGMYAGTDSI